MDIAEAKRALRQAAARLLVKKEETEAQVSDLDTRRTDLTEGADRALAAGDAELEAEARRALASVEARLTQQRDLLMTLDKDYSDALQELRALDGLRSRGERARLVGAVGALSSPDPLLPSAEDRALAHARDGILELEARAEVQEEMAAEGAKARALEQRLAALRSEDPEADARAELARLKAKLRTLADVGAPSADDDGEGAPPPPKRKRTL